MGSTRSRAGAHGAGVSKGGGTRLEVGRAANHRGQEKGVVVCGELPWAAHGWMRDRALSLNLIECDTRHTFLTRSWSRSHSCCSSFRSRASSSSRSRSGKKEVSTSGFLPNLLRALGAAVASGDAPSSSSSPSLLSPKESELRLTFFFFARRCSTSEGVGHEKQPLVQQLSQAEWFKAHPNTNDGDITQVGVSGRAGGWVGD